MENIPKIDTSIIPNNLFTWNSELARSIAMLDDIENNWSREHHDAVMQVINDAAIAGYDIKL
jgi:hypothetical protein